MALNAHSCGSESAGTLDRALRNRFRILM